MTKHKKQQPYPIYCINLKSQTERRALIENQANHMNLDVTFIEALAPDDAETEEFNKLYDEKMRLSKYKLNITPGERACFASHIKTLKTFLESDEKYCIIIEDSVEIHDIFHDFMETVDLKSLDFDILRAGNQTKSKMDFPYCKMGQFTLKFTSQASIGTYTLLFSRRGAQKVIKSAKGHYQPYDLHLGYIWRHKLKTLSVTPVITARAAVPSAIDTIDTKIGGESRLKKNNRNVKWSNRIRQRGDRIKHSVLKYVYPFFWSLKARLTEKH